MKAIEKRELHYLILQLKEFGLRGHYSCEDNWFSCPKAPEGCSDDSKGEECNCGADERNQQVEELYRTIIKRL